MTSYRATALCALTGIVSTACLWAAPPARAVDAVLIQVDNAGRPTVVVVDAASLTLPEGSRGLIVWADGNRERWQRIAGPWRLPLADATEWPELAAASRSRGTDGDAGGAPAAGLLTTQLEQLGGVALMRGGDPLAPWNNGRMLDGRVTFRLKADKDGESKAAVLVVLRDKGEVVRVPFAAGQTRVRWSEIANLSKDLANGLPPGDYTLRKEGTPFEAKFTVETARRRAAVLRHAAPLDRLLGDPADLIAVEAAVDEMLAPTDETGKTPRPYLGDALDRLESVPAAAVTPYLKRTHEFVLKWLQDPGQDPKTKEPDAEATGVAAVDRARDLIAGGQWQKAADALDAMKPDDTADGRRAAALADLYRGVILAESAQAGAGRAADAFRRAVAGLEGGDPADLYRARNDYANFLTGAAQDRLYNHAFQMAAGVKRPILTALTEWAGARAQYDAALESAGKLGPAPVRAVRVNQARLYALLADVIRTLGDPRDPATGFPEGDKAAAALAKQLAEQAGAGGDGDPLIRASAEELLAQLAFRGGADADCLSHAHEAGEIYRQTGSLVGAESVERLTGLAFRRRADAGTGPAAAKDRDDALRHFLIANQLAEVLRDQYPADRSGQTRAGFFARRAYVNEQIVELLVGQGKDSQALTYAEAAKARALQDLLAAGRERAAAGETAEPGDVLTHWPKDTAALEYFLGTERGWVFVVDPNGAVRAYELKDAAGGPLATRDLIARVHTFLTGVGHQAPKMSAALNSGRGFDHKWQDDLNGFFKELIPAAALADLRRARTVVVVPQHILHYLPFAALVTERDAAERGPFEMVQPRFLLDEPFDLCYAPSLAAWDLIRQAPARPIAKASALGIVAIPGAPELPGVAEDLKNVKDAFAGKVGEILEGDAATPDAARRLFRQPGLLLIATHGNNVADRPLESTLLLYPDKDSDGRLTAADVYGAEVDADLVVMSACYSGLADRSPLPGDDLFGLQRAFLEAGARGVVSGQWDVYDGTGPELMKGLFQGVAAGKSAPAALAASQRAFLAKLRAGKDNADPWFHPYFWAVYTAAGDDRASGK